MTSPLDVPSRSPEVASAALVCGAVLSESVPEVVRRWVNEIQEATSSKHAMVQFHALALLYELKKNDRLALHKVSKTLQQDVKIAAFWENPENIWSNLLVAKFWQILQHFVKN